MAGLEISELGERGLIDVLRRRARPGSRRFGLGIGDDAALARPRAGCDWVVTSDALIEDVHFRWSTTDARSLGHKALEVNLSDLAAMGARPRGCLLSFGLPASADPRQIEGFVAGLLAAARRAACPLVGGDTVRAPVWMLSITAMGEVERGTALLRSGARVGDRILVTGRLGGAALGLQLLETGRGGEPGAGPFVRRQLRPTARLEAGRRLRKIAGVTAALDLSDGLASDLGHIARASGVAARIELEQLPLARGLRRRCEALGLDPEALALGGGEDYELLFCARPAAPPADRLAARLGCPVTEIGRITRGAGVHYRRAGQPVTPPVHGFEHFKPTPSGSDK